jgi:hypothetical protein
MIALLFSRHLPGAAHHEVVRCRPGIARNSAFVTIPDQRRSANALHRVRETLLMGKHDG